MGFRLLLLFPTAFSYIAHYRSAGDEEVHTPSPSVSSRRLHFMWCMWVLASSATQRILLNVQDVRESQLNPRINDANVRGPAVLVDGGSTPTPYDRLK